jgi:hypothetical protein
MWGGAEAFASPAPDNALDHRIGFIRRLHCSGTVVMPRTSPHFAFRGWQVRIMQRTKRGGLGREWKGYSMKARFLQLVGRFGKGDETFGRASNVTSKKRCRKNFDRAKSGDLVRCLAKTPKSTTFFTEPNCALRGTKGRSARRRGACCPPTMGCYGSSEQKRPRPALLGGVNVASY